ncbi:MAG: response regulator transcription factor [Spirochaetia bacterium]|nr:response regulator transcription factor [Spirochaetia bacterium]
MENEKKSLIYVIEDHQVIANGVKQYLEFSNLDCQVFYNLEDAKKAFEIKIPDLLLQDVMLPDGDGFTFVKNIRKKYNFPVIFMTARAEESDRILGFEIGADDYITKPFSPKELVLRVQAVLKRTNTSTSLLKDTIYYYKEGYTLFIDKNAHLLKLDDNEIILTAAEWRVLLCLVDNSHLLVSRAKILNECFNYSSESYERIVDTHIKNIRAKIAYGNWIETVRGYGYRFVGVDKKDYL